MLLTRCQGPFPGDDDSDRDHNGSLSLYTQYSILTAAFPKGHYYDPRYTEEETGAQRGQVTCSGTHSPSI